MGRNKPKDTCWTGSGISALTDEGHVTGAGGEQPVQIRAGGARPQRCQPAASKHAPRPLNLPPGVQGRPLSWPGVPFA
eukprot:scaffold112375_cov34-Prasinocladus_malaysianus.AAC.1